MSLIGKTIGNYAITKLLGEGGMGAVYLAEHPLIGKKVALKVLHLEMAGDPDIVARFFNEARAINAIRHDNIVEVLDFGQTPDGYPYFIMEFLPGEPLADAVARGPMAAHLATEIGGQIALGLQAAHDKGIVHRDLKPQNVFLLPSRGAPHVKILDFGVAKMAQGADGAASVKTRAGAMMGTPAYMSPEQCKGATTLDHRTDIYALGILVFEMLAGRPPFQAEGAGQLFVMQMLHAPPLLSDLVPGAPQHLVDAVARALAKEPDARFASMAAFRAALLGRTDAALAPNPTQTLVGTAPPVPHPLPGSPGAEARPQQTTLSSAVAEVDDSALEAPMGRRGRAPLLVGGGLAAAAAIVAVVMLGGRSPTGGDVAPAAGSAPLAAAKAPAAAPPAGGARTVTISLDATPAGAHVLRKTDGKDLGGVPIRLTLPADGGQPSFLFRLTGYRDAERTVQLTADQTLTVALDKAPAAAAPTPATPRPARARKATSLPGVVAPKSDKDDLATPKF